MNQFKSNSDAIIPNPSLEEYDGVYGKFIINEQDKKEVFYYRLSVLICGLSFLSGMISWLFFGPTIAWIQIIPMGISLGLALKWIHIYIRPLHLALQALWALGSVGIIILIINNGDGNFLSSIRTYPILTILISPLFAALTGLGFKEFFCFRRIEAIGLTLLLPIALISHFIGLFNDKYNFSLLLISALLLVVMAIRKFQMNAQSDIGDKSVFEFLSKQNKN